MKHACMWTRLFWMSWPSEQHFEDLGPCWCWLGQTTPSRSGRLYPRININQHGKVRKLYAHRLSFQEFVAPIPRGFDVDHRCRNTLCIAPDHLQAIPAIVNQRDLVRSRRRV